MANDRVKAVNNIAHNNGKLEEKALDLVEL